MLAKCDGLHSLLLTTRMIEVTFLGKSCGGSIVAVIGVIGVISLSFYRISRTIPNIIAVISVISVIPRDAQRGFITEQCTRTLLPTSSA